MAIMGEFPRQYRELGMGMATQGRSLRRRWRGRLWGLTLLPLGLVSIWWGQRHLKAQIRVPQAIVVLGGSSDREQYAARLAQEHPDLEVWVSSGSNPEYAEWVFQEAQIDPARVYLDYQAVDTVTNFTTLVDQLESHHIRHVYLVTSDYHMRRALIIGHIVLGSRDITFRPLLVPSSHPEPEPLLLGLRDGARALLWLVTGRTGSSLRGSLFRS